VIAQAVPSITLARSTYKGGCTHMDMVFEAIKVIVCIAILAAIINYVLHEGIPQAGRFRGRKRRR
jgi:hypothetical protein